jgi:hypothetical protein
MRTLKLTATLLAIALFASAETQGSITLTKDGDFNHTVVKVSSVTRGPILLMVTVLYKPTLTGLDASEHRIVPRFGMEAVFAIFDIPVAHVISVSVGEYVPGESQNFQN